jgi:hypothetical protein
MTAPKPSSRPRSRQAAIRVPAPHRHRHLERELGRVAYRQRVAEKHHDAVTRKLVERALVLRDEGSKRTVVLAQEIEHFLRLSSFGEAV